MRDHIKILGILNIVMGVFVALIGVVVLLVMSGIAGVITASVQSATDAHDAAVAAPIAAAIGLGIAIFFFVLALPSIIGGWGLVQFKSWSRVLMIVVSAFHLIHVPLGTALGIYGLWVLFKPETEQILRSGGRWVPPVPAPVGYPASYQSQPPPAV